MSDHVECPECGDNEFLIEYDRVICNKGGHILKGAVPPRLELAINPQSEGFPDDDPVAKVEKMRRDIETLAGERKAAFELLKDANAGRGIIAEGIVTVEMLSAKLIVTEKERGDAKAMIAARYEATVEQSEASRLFLNDIKKALDINDGCSPFDAIGRLNAKLSAALLLVEKMWKELKKAHHSLCIAHGLTATDKPVSEDHGLFWTLNYSAEMKSIDEVCSIDIASVSDEAAKRKRVIDAARTHRDKCSASVCVCGLDVALDDLDRSEEKPPYHMPGGPPSPPPPPPGRRGP